MGIRTSGSLNTLLQMAELGPQIGRAEHLGLLPADTAQHLGTALQGGAASRLLGHPRDVRAHDDVVALEEAAVRGHGLLLEDVDPRRADLAALETGQEGVLVLDLAAGGIDEDHAVLHLRDRLRVDHVVRLGRMRRVARDDVGGPEDGGHVGHGLDAAIPELFGGHVLVVGDHAHPEGARRLGHAPPDVAHADDAERLAVHLEQALRAALAPVGHPRAPVDHHACLANASMSMTACSATELEFEPGAWTTAMPRSVAALRSMVSRPTPCRPTTLSCLQPAMRERVHAGLARKSMPSASCATLSIPASVSSLDTSTRASLSSSLMPSAWMGPARTTKGFMALLFRELSRRLAAPYFVATSTMRGDSSVKGRPSSPPKSSTWDHRSDRSMRRSSWTEYRRISISPRRR